MATNVNNLDFNIQKTSTARLSVLSNMFLVLVKLLVGILTGSVSIISEALHSGNDLAAAVMAFYSVKKAAEPADTEHHFGHGKFESVSGAAEGLLIFAVAIGIIYAAVRKLIEGVHEVEMLGWGMAVMLLSVAVNIIVSRKLMRVAKETDSVALAADAWHLKTDVYTSLGVFIGLLVIVVGERLTPGTHWHFLDPVIAIAVALLILKAAYDITREAMGHLLDVALPAEEQQMIRELVEDHYPQALEVHELRTRRSGSERYVDLHLVVPKDTHVEDAHTLCDHLETRISEMFPGTNLLIHLEPGEMPQKKEKPE